MTHETTGYRVPRCPRCSKVRGRRLGYDLVEVRRTAKAVIVYCNFCHYQWRCTNRPAMAGILKKQETAR